MGLHKTIQEQSLEKEFNVKASAPMSGAYDLAGVQEEPCSRSIHIRVIYPIYFSLFKKSISYTMIYLSSLKVHMILYFLPCTRDITAWDK